MPSPTKHDPETGPPANRVDLHLQPGPQAPGAAREMVAQACRRWQIPQQLSDDAQLIVSELVTNGIIHARSELRVTVVIGTTHLHLYVRDGGHGVPHLSMRHYREHGSIGGLGLRLVDSVAAEWGTTVGARGKTVWATLEVPASSASPRVTRPRS